MTPNNDMHAAALQDKVEELTRRNRAQEEAFQQIEAVIGLPPDEDRSLNQIIEAVRNRAYRPAPDPYAELKAAQANGAVIQLNYSAFPETDWRLFTGDFDEHCEIPPHYYRIKPTPKLVPMTPDDLPPVVWVRRKDTPQIQLLVYRCDTETGCLTVAGSSIYPSNIDEWEWSPDRRTWHSFMKEVEA